MYELYIEKSGVLAVYESLQALMPVIVISEQVVPTRSKSVQALTRAFLPSERKVWYKNSNTTPKLMTPFALWGIHPCSARALKLTDAVFLDAPADSDYREMRSRAVLVGFDCFAPRESCFCNSFGDNALFDSDECDITFAKTDTGFLVRAKTVVAQSIISDCGAHPATSEQMKSAMQIMDAASEFLSKNNGFLNLQSRKSISLQHTFSIDNDILSQCLQCGACTRVCPCCFCFSLHDEPTVRVSQNQSCMTKNFDNNGITKSIAKRLHHKFVYLPSRYGALGCTGCGECIDVCTAQIDFRYAVKMINHN